MGECLGEYLYGLRHLLTEFADFTSETPHDARFLSALGELEMELTS